MPEEVEAITQKNNCLNGNRIYNLVNEFDFFGSSDSEYGELVHNIVDHLGTEITDNERIFEILKKKLTISEKGTLNLFNSLNNSKSNIKDIVVSEELYFDCRASLKKELRRISQNIELNSQVTQPKDIYLIRYVFSYHRMFNDKNDIKYPQEYDIFVIRHPKPELNGCRTFALKKKSEKLECLTPNLKDEFIPISYVSCTNKIKTKWEHCGKQIINIMCSIVNIVPRDIKLYITTLQDIYPVSQRNSVDSYILYIKLLFYGIKLLPNSLSILLRFLFNKLISIESEIHAKNPNNFTKERFEKWRQEELQNIAIKIRKGEYKDINVAKQYIQDDQGLKTRFSEKFVEEDIDRNAQIIDNITIELFEFIDEVCENGLKYLETFEKNRCEYSKCVSTKTLNFFKDKRNLLSSSDFESSATEETLIPCYGKKEQFFKQCIDLENTILNIFETQILAIENCQFVNYIPIYFICYNDEWCEKFFQIAFKKLFDPYETLIIRKISVDYIVSFVTNYKKVSNFKFFTPCIKYLMQFLHEFVAHWNIEKASQIQSGNEYYESKRFDFNNNLNKNVEEQIDNNLKNLFGLYCHVVQSLCWLFSVISFTVEKFGISSTEDLNFFLDSIFSIKRGFISFIICGDLTPLNNIETKALFTFLNFSLQLLEKTRNLNCEIKLTKYNGSIKLAKKLLDSFNLNEGREKFIFKSFLDKMFLWHSEKYLKKIYSNNIELMNKFCFSYKIDDLLRFVKAQDKIELQDNQTMENEIKENLSDNVYGKMESSILPEQSLWEHVWGDLPVSQEELEQDLYVTKNKMFKLEFDGPYSTNVEKKRSKKEKSQNHSKDIQSPNKSLLDVLLSSEAYKRSEINMYNFRRKNMILRKGHNRFTRNSGLI